MTTGATTAPRTPTPQHQLTAGLYIRCSTPGQIQTGSVDQQLAEGRKWARDHGYNLPERLIFTDAGISGTRTDRADFWELIKAVDTGQLHVLLAWDLWRTGSNEMDHAVLTMALRRNNVRVEVISTKGSHILDNPENRLTFGINLLLSDYRREKFLLDGDRGKDRHATEGCHVNGPAPYGYTATGPRGRKRLHPNQDAPRAREIFSRYLAGEGLKQLWTWLNATEPRGSKRSWNHMTLSRILDNPVYAGHLRWRGNLYPGAHPGLVSQEEFDAVQRLRRERRGRHPGRPRGTARVEETRPHACPVPGCKTRARDWDGLEAHFARTPNLGHHTALEVLRQARARGA